MEEFVENFYSFDFAGDLVVNDGDEEEIDFETLGIENSMGMMKMRLLRKMKTLSH